MPSLANQPPAVAKVDITQSEEHPNEKLYNVKANIHTRISGTGLTALKNLRSRMVRILHTPCSPLAARCLGARRVQ